MSVEEKGSGKHCSSVILLIIEDNEYNLTPVLHINIFEYMPWVIDTISCLCA